MKRKKQTNTQTNGMLDELPKEQVAALRKKFDEFVEEASKALQAKNQVREDESMKGLKRWPDGRVTIPKKMVAELVELGRTAIEEHAFKPGDIVRWKPGLEHRDLGESGIAIVTQVLDAPRRQKKRSAGKPSTGRGHEDEVLDIVIGTVVGLHADTDLVPEMFLELHTEKRRLEPAENPDRAYAAKLASMYNELVESDGPFQKGDVVVWKERLVNKVVPSLGMPAIVVSVKEAPAYYDGDETDSPYFWEPIDLVVLTEVNEDKDTSLMVGVDSRRMKHANN